MRGLQRIEEEYDRFLRGQPACLSEEERARIRELSHDIPGHVGGPGTTAADRKEVIRLLVERVVVWVRKDSEEVEATIHWRGGWTSDHTVVRPVRRDEHLHHFNRLVDHLTEWRQEGYSTGQSCREAAGGRVPAAEERSRRATRRGRCNNFLRRCGLTDDRRKVGDLGPNQWWLSDLAGALNLPAFKLRDWAGRGWVHGRRATPAQRFLDHLGGQVLTKSGYAGSAPNRDGES